MKIEAFFGGILALFVIAIAFYALFSFPPGGRPDPGYPDNGYVDGGDPLDQIVAADASVVCQCYDAGFELAGSDVGVMSSQYRTGYEQCRALGDQQGGDAWTDGWNARLSAKPYEASCRAYQRRRGA